MTGTFQCLPDCLTYLSVCLSVCLSAACLPISLVFLYVRRSVCLSACLSFFPACLPLVPANFHEGLTKPHYCTLPSRSSPVRIVTPLLTTVALLFEHGTLDLMFSDK